MKFIAICKTCSDSINKITCEKRFNLAMWYRVVKCKHCKTQYRHYKYILDWTFVVMSGVLAFVLMAFGINGIFIYAILFYAICRLTAIYCIPLDLENLR